MAEPSGTPAAKPIDVNEIITGFRQLQAFGAQAMQDMETAYAAAERASGAAAGAASAEGRASVEVNTILGNAALRTKAANEAAAADFGTNPNANTYVISKMGEQIRESVLKTEARRQQVQESLDASFFDNPLDWLGAQIQLPFQQASLELNENRTASLIGSLAKLQSLTLDQGKINAAVNEATSTELIAAQNKMIMARAAKDAAAASERLARLGIDRISMRRALTMDQFDATIRANDVVMRIQGRDLEQRRLELADNADRRAEEQAKRERQLFDITVALREGDLEAKQRMTAGLERATSILGIRNLGIFEYQQLPANDPTKRAIDSLLLSPTDMAFNRIASSPAIALDRLSNIPVQQPPNVEYARQKLMEEVYRVRKNEEITWKNYSPEVRQQKVDEAIAAYVKNQKANIPESGGLFSPPPLASVINMPVWNNNPIVEKLKPLAVNPNYALRPDDVVTAAIAFLREQTAPGQLPDIRLINVAAADIAFLYQGVIVDNNTLRQYTTKFAIPGLDIERDGFNTTVYNGSMLNGRDVVNMANREAVSAFLLRRIGREDFTKNFSSGIMGGIPIPQGIQQPTAPRREGAR